MEKVQVFFVSPVPFHALRQRHQGLAGEFLHHGFQVIFMDPLESPGFSVVQNRIENHFHRVSVSVPFRAARYPRLQEIAIKIAVKLLSKKKFWEPKNSILWIADPSMANIANENWKTCFYDRCDRHGFFPGQNVNNWRYYEKRLFKRADQVFASSQTLLEEAENLVATGVHLLPNAASADWVDSSRPAGKKTGRSLSKNFASFAPFCGIDRIKVVSSGAHYEWVDFSWLFMLAENDRIELHLAGTGRGESFDRLIRDPRVKWHSNLDRFNLKNLIDTCRVGVVPFRDIPLTHAVDPVKIYEYAARGLAIWTPNVAGIRNHPLVDSIVTDERSLAAALKSIPETLRNSDRKNQIPTWADRFKTISPLLPP